MKRDPSAEVASLLRDLRRRYLVRFYWDTLATLLLVSGAIAVSWAAWVHFSGPAFTMPPWVFAALGIGPLLLAAVWVVAKAPSLRRIAEIVDRLGATKDRLLTALTLEERRESLSRLENLAHQECHAFLGGHNLRRLLPVAPPRFALWLCVPLVAWTLFAWLGHLDRLAFEAEKARAQAAIAGTKDALEKLSRDARQAAEQAKSDELRKLAEQMQRSAERLKNEAHPDQAQKAALRELSSLEEMMRELQRQPSPMEEVKELAKALSPLPGMQDVANAINEKDLAEAQRAMEQAMQKQTQQKPDQLSEEQAEKQLQKAMQRLGDQRRLSAALQQFVDRMKQQLGGGLSQQAMKQLQQMLEQMGRQPEQGQNAQGQKTRQMTLQEMIAALENMKFGEGQARQGSESPQEILKGPQIAIQSFGANQPQGQPQSGNANQPSGRPGSEHDFGTTDTPFGPKSDPQEKGGELALKGQFGEGETLSLKLPSAGDNSKAARRYKELFEAAASAAEDSVQQENIPLGSRFLVKRYFESIRPKE